MWAQNAAAMYTYAAASSAATKMSLFDKPPRTTNMAGQSTQEAVAVQSVSNSVEHNQALASQLTSALSEQLQTLANAGSASGSASSGSNSPWTSILLAMVAGFNTLTGPLNFLGQISRTMSSATSSGLGVYRTSLQAPPCLGTARCNEGEHAKLGSRSRSSCRQCWQGGTGGQAIRTAELDGGLFDN